MAEITHATAGRINVTAGKRCVTLKLAQWSLKPDATLELQEALYLVRRVQEEITKATGVPDSARASAPVAAEADDDPW